MHLLYWLLFPSLLYVHVEAGGIVKSVLNDGKEEIPTDFLKLDAKYKQFLECSYIHNFESTYKTKVTKHQHVFFLQCIQLKGSEETFVVLYFNSLAIDRMVVKSCDKKEVESSIFPPKLDITMKAYYGLQYTHQRERVSPTFRYLKEGDDKCYARSYTVELTKDTEEFVLIYRKPPPVDNTRDEECAEVKFTNCEAPPNELADIVTKYSESNVRFTAANWIPYINDNKLAFKGDGSNLIIKETIQCTVPYPGPKTSDVYYELVCVMVEEKGKYLHLAFVNQRSGDDLYNMETFTVTTCEPSSLAIAIFPRRDNNPQFKKGCLWFIHKKKCYERNYNNDQKDKNPTEIVGPSDVLDWINPKTDSTAMWRSCTKILNPVQKLLGFQEINL